MNKHMLVVGGLVAVCVVVSILTVLASPAVEAYHRRNTSRWIRESIKRWMGETNEEIVIVKNELTKRGAELDPDELTEKYNSKVELLRRYSLELDAIK